LNCQSAGCPLCLSRDLRGFHLGRDPRRGDLPYRECGACGFIFLDQSRHLSRSEERARYRLHQNDDAPGYRGFLDRLVGPLAPFLPRGARGLDYGCGPNPVLAAMLDERGWPAEYYDPYFFPDRDKLEARYDFVTCTEVVEHFRFPFPEFHFVDRALLRPGALLAVMTAFFNEGDDFAGWWYPREQTHVGFYRPRALESVARRWGWDVLHLRDNVGIFRKR
jgi:hypothetical protein